MKPALLLLLAVPVFAQLQVQVALSGSLTPAANAISLNATAVGAVAETQFRAVNTGSASIPLQTLTVSGAGYSLAAPFQPVTLIPGGTYDFKVRFSPAATGSYSAVLTVNLFTTLLRTTAVLAPALSLGGEALTEAGLRFATSNARPVTQVLSLYNYSDQPLTVATPILSGAAFRLLNDIAAPVVLGPGQTLDLQVQFAPPGDGTFSGALGLSVYRVTLTGVSTRARVPAPRILLETSVVENAQQVRIRVRLETPSLIDGAGSLRLAFLSPMADPAVMFTDGAMEAPFTVTAGSAEALFASGPFITAQTGTTAGTIILVAATEGGGDTISRTLAPSPISIDTATATRNGSTLEVTLAGFDNTRSAGSLNFRFFDRAGNLIGGVITSRIDEEFSSYFRQSVLGGIFRLRAAFPVTGDATMVGSVVVELANTIGRTDVPRLTFP